MMNGYFTLASFSKRFKNLENLDTFTEATDILGPPIQFNPIIYLTDAKPSVCFYGLDDLYPRIKKVLIHNHLKVFSIKNFFFKKFQNFVDPRDAVR